MRATSHLRYNGVDFFHSCRKQITEHLESKQPRTDPQKVEIQERRNTLARRIRLWKTAQAIYMPQVSRSPDDEQYPSAFDDPDEFQQSKPELWPLLLPSELLQDDRSFCHKGVVETEQTLRLAQVQDNLVDLRRHRRTLRSLKTYFRSNVVGEGQKAQTKSRAIESGVNLRIHRAARRYRLAYIALVSLDPMGDWRTQYLELTGDDNRGPGKELYEQGVGDGHYTMSWIWSSLGSEVQVGASSAEGEEVNETIRHEWMTCRARADRWREELDLLQEEMSRTVAFLEWKSGSWGKGVGSRSGSVTADIQCGIDAYAFKQASIYHELAVSLANQWIPRLLTLGLSTSWTKAHPWALGIVSAADHSLGSANTNENPSGDPPSEGTALLSKSRGSTAKSVDSDRDSGGDSDDESDPGVCDGGESSDGLGMDFEYDDKYMP